MQSTHLRLIIPPKKNYTRVELVIKTMGPDIWEYLSLMAPLQIGLVRNLFKCHLLHPRNTLPAILWAIKTMEPARPYWDAAWAYNSSSSKVLSFHSISPLIQAPMDFTVLLPKRPTIPEPMTNLLNVLEAKSTEIPSLWFWCFRIGTQASPLALTRTSFGWLTTWKWTLLQFPKRNLFFSAPILYH